MPSPNIGHLLYQSMVATLRDEAPGHDDAWYEHRATVLMSNAKAMGERLRASRHWPGDPL